MINLSKLRYGFLVLLAVLGVVLPVHGAGAPLPSEPPGFGAPDTGPVDGCGCLAELEKCIREADTDLESCLDFAPDPGRDLLCYLRFEVEVRLCLDDPGDCPLICAP